MGGSSGDSVVASDIRARQSARRLISVFTAQSGGVSVNKRLWSFATSCWTCILRGISGLGGDLIEWSCVRVGCRSLCGFFLKLVFVHIFLGEGKGEVKVRGESVG